MHQPEMRRPALPFPAIDLVDEDLLHSPYQRLIPRSLLPLLLVIENLEAALLFRL